MPKSLCRQLRRAIDGQQRATHWHKHRRVHAARQQPHQCGELCSANRYGAQSGTSAHPLSRWAAKAKNSMTPHQQDVSTLFKKKASGLAKSAMAAKQVESAGPSQVSGGLYMCEVTSNRAWVCMQVCRFVSRLCGHSWCHNTGPVAASHCCRQTMHPGHACCIHAS